MVRKKKGDNEELLEQYLYSDKKRTNNPPVGLVTSETDRDAPKKEYQYDPHLDPQLQWTGKAERTSFEVDTVSLHVHERIDPMTIIRHVCKDTYQKEKYHQISFFEKPENVLPLREAIDFYKHDQNWSNRLIAGDSLLVMNSLLEKEGMAGKVQMIYIDPPYGVKYGSNFQPFINKRDVKDGKDDDLTAEPEMIRAFRDTWELGIHSYLTYLRDRLLLAKELLTESGSCFVQIGDENVHLVRCLMDEVFGRGNFVSQISYMTTTARGSDKLDGIYDIILWYAKNIDNVKVRHLFVSKEKGLFGYGQYDFVETVNGEIKKLADIKEADKPISEPFAHSDTTSQGETPTGRFKVEFKGQIYYPPPNRHWATTPEGMDILIKNNRIFAIGNRLRYKRYASDFPVRPLTNLWIDTNISGFSEPKRYVVQTLPLVIERCLLMTTDPGDLVFDPTCGSGTTAYVAEKWGRRWITSDTSRVAIALAKQRLMTAVFDYYELAYPEEGVSGGFKYKTVPHITLKSIANNEPPAEEILYDQPYIDRKKKRITGPFTVEAVPAPVVKSLEDIEREAGIADASIARSGETLRQAEWRAELLKTGIRGKGGQYIEFTRIEPLPGTRWLHADGETKEDEPKRVVVSFGPEYAPLEQRQVELAIEEAQRLVPRPKLIVFAAFQFDPEAAKDIDELKWPGVTLLKVQMNADLLTADLKKKRASNQSFWLIGQPDISIRKSKGKYIVEVHGFDYYNPRTGQIESGDTSKIAMWMLDTDYDGRSLYPKQVFFPMAGEKDGWKKLAKNLKAQIDEDLIEQYHGTVSLPFTPGKHRRVAVKIIDDRGIESLKVLEVK
ncbi:type III R-M system Adenine specific DNA methylase [Moorella thermoacetica Y72]|uniref:Type III R-M system Adenine specific DNA methylase n=1 Tax=Moorella thermoacetica Y72 TaxID=1325331 RepID=A0A0S6UHA0_NEOTH|nr:site-specific DNA-methyltransferase [Moorella thermoacetica]GAF26363.1 type III R-M system Adenine specific DNA methylase [Moorella thermoacetica Y72]